jgi:multiple sugar transport system substrate-binding protein
MRTPCRWFVLAMLTLWAVACAPTSRTTTVTISGSALGAEGAVLRRQLAAFEAGHPGVTAEAVATPDAADQRHQLYVQRLNAHVPDPDVLQLDVIWTAEFAGAGWIRPLDDFAPDVSDFVPAAIAASRWRGRLYAVPWFVDLGLLYRRTDLVAEAPRSLAALNDVAGAAQTSGRIRYGVAWQGARYEGLVTVFLEHLGAFGGGILDDRGRVIVDRPPAFRALTFMRDSIADGVVPASALTWQEEQTRFAFQNGDAAFMRNWPYAWALLQDGARSRVAGRVGVSTFPAADGGRPSAALGGAQLAINAFSAQPALAWELVRFLIEPERMLERARVAAQFPPRRSLYDGAALASALPVAPDEARRLLDAAVARPVTPVYTELSELLQVQLHRALSGQSSPDAALRAAAADMRALLARSGLSAPEDAP